MNIYQLVNKFNLEEPQSTLEIYIGKNLNKQLFNTNNKIFFDILYSYLIKNNWILSHQMIQKTIQAKNIYLQSNLTSELTNYLDFEIPFSQEVIVYKKMKELNKKFRGTYYDIFCNYYVKTEVDHSEFQKNVDSIFNEIVEETTIFSKKSTPFNIYFTIEKNTDSSSNQIQNMYTVKLVFTEKIQSDEQLDEFMEILDLAMTKYKKTNKTITSIFTPI